MNVRRSGRAFPTSSFIRISFWAICSGSVSWSKGDDALTGAMISNYIKMGLMPGPADKKYTREHIAYLTAIQALKQVISVADTGLLLRSRRESDMQRFYEEFRERLNGAMDVSGRRPL